MSDNQSDNSRDWLVHSAGDTFTTKGMKPLAEHYIAAPEGSTPGTLLVVVPVPMVLTCPRCKYQHIDKPEPRAGWDNPPHRSHKCRACETIWRPADVATTGVAALETRGKADTWPPTLAIDGGGRDDMSAVAYHPV